MNICILVGKIKTNIEFKFILKSKKISIVNFKMQLKNKSIVQVKAYDEIADKCYKLLEKNDIIEVQGKLNSKMEIIIEDFNIL